MCIRDSTWTPASVVRRKFNAGPRRKSDHVVTPVVAIHEACILLDDLRNEMAVAGLSRDDVKVYFVSLAGTPDQPQEVWARPIPEPAGLPGLFEEVARMLAGGKFRPLGIGVWQRDREVEALNPLDPKRETVWVRPFVTGERDVRALFLAKELCAGGENGGSISFD